jgi:hypothetical protein
LKQSIFVLLVFLNGIFVGGIGAWIIEERLDPPAPGSRYRFERARDGEIGFFDRRTGKYMAFHHHESLRFLTIHDPSDGSVTYRETKLLEDPSFLDAIENLKTELPERSGRDLRLKRLVE